MAVAYYDRRIIHVHCPAGPDAPPSVIVEPESLGDDATWALAFAFRLRNQPDTYASFSFLMFWEGGLNVFLQETEMELRRICSCANARDRVPTIGELPNGADAHQPLGGCAQGREVEINWNGDPVVDVMFNAPLIRVQNGEYGTSSGVRISLLFSSRLIIPAFLIQFHSAVTRLLDAVQYGTGRPASRLAGTPRLTPSGLYA